MPRALDPHGKAERQSLERKAAVRRRQLQAAKKAAGNKLAADWFRRPVPLAQILFMSGGM